MIRECWGYSDTSVPCQVKEGEALKTLDQLKENAGQRYVSAYSFALVYAGSARKISRFNGSNRAIRSALLICLHSRLTRRSTTSAQTRASPIS